MKNKKTLRIVNRHYIGVIREVNCRLKYEEVDIPQEDILIEEIEEMKKNDNYTILDVQALLTEFYPEEKFKGKYYDYLYPQMYDDAYVSGASYPHILTEEEYEQKLQEEEWGRMQAYKKSLREGFHCQNFIFAHRYMAKLRDIKNESNVKMYSTDQIGWKEFEYKVNDDITVYIKTNFGYGSASYFFCNLKYKDINILPYSWLVKYYYVKMIDFVRYTRCYVPRRTSWGEVFKFTVETANMAKFEPEKFINEWIIKEVEEMMKGMRQYMSKPDRELEDFLKVKNRPNLFKIHEVAEYALKDVIRNCNDRDIEEYKALPEEKVIAFKAEKITGNLLLLDNLRKLTEIATVIIPYIAEIEEMNLKLLPEIEKHMNNISVDIKRLNKRLNEVFKTLDQLKILLDNHKKKIERIKKEINEGIEEKDKINELKVEKNYEEKHPEYVQLKAEYVQLKDKYEKLKKNKEWLEKDIKRRENFLKILTKCKERIAKYIKAA